MHLNMVSGDMVIGYTKEDSNWYYQKVRELLANGFVLEHTEFRPSGDMLEHFQKEDEVFVITHLAI